MMKHKGTLVLTEHRKQMTVRVFPVRLAELKRGTKPTEIGRVEFYLHRDKYLRPLTFHVESLGKVQRISPDNFTHLVKKATNIFLSKNISGTFRKRIITMLKDFSVSAKIGVIQHCEFCLINDKLTWMTNRGFNALGRNVCERCALNELERELKRHQIPLDDSMRYLTKQLLRKTRDADFVTRSLLPGAANPIQPELTLFNVRSALDFKKKMSLKELKIPPPLLEVLRQENIAKLMPIQIHAIQNGLLDGQNLLIISETSSGKTLIAELSGISKILNDNKKMVYLAPLVALANNKHTEFNRRYKQLGIKVALRVGISRLNIGEKTHVQDSTGVSSAQIIIGTYEGIDFQLRKGEKTALGEVGTIVIDEVQMLTDEERGAELDGLISRLRILYPNAQIIALSATVGNPDELAQMLGLNLVQLTGRPIPLEEHLIVTLADNDKLSRLIELTKHEWMTRSSTGFRGQTLIFTNSRRRVQHLASKLRTAGLKAAGYHAGYSYGRRRFVEDQFLTGKLQTVVATYALGAGVDFPASQVIFENLCMGNKYLTVSEFTQMTGRAGRLGKHDRGKAFLLASPIQGCAGARDRTETTAALQLLNGKIEPVNPEYDEDISSEQFQASFATIGSVKKTEGAYSLLVGRSISSKQAIKRLEKDRFITRRNGVIALTPFGKTCSLSFFSIKTALKVRKALAKGINPLDIALELQPLSNVYIANNVHSILERVFGTRFSTRVFSGSTLDVMDASLGGLHKRLPKWVMELFVKWSRAFFDCNCEENPYCNCAQTKLGKYLVRVRSQGNAPRRMVSILEKKYSFFVYEGDALDWLNRLVHVLDGISRVAQALKYQKLAISASEQARIIERP